MVCFFGDGASNRGAVHKAMNMCSIWKLPVIFVVENNQYASTTSVSYACSVGGICARAAGYNIPGVSVDGNDVLALREAASEVVDRARAGNVADVMRHINSRAYPFEKVNNFHCKLEDLEQTLADTAKLPEGFIKVAVIFDLPEVPDG